jgi:hypothetical protein
VLEPGDQELTIARGGEVIASASIALAPGDHLSVETLIDRALPRWTIALRAGAAGFLDSAVSRTIAEPIGVLGAAVRMRDAPWEGFDPLFDITFGMSRQTVHPADADVEQRLRLYRAGLGFAFATEVGTSRLYGGPALAFVVLDRRIDVPELSERQTFATFMPGVVGGASMPIGDFALELEAQVHYLPLVVDGSARSVLMASLFGGAGYRF